jgi:type II secretory pathway pseudopilin PulG
MNSRSLSLKQVGQGRLGYTMVELAMVFALIGILSLMGIPKIRQVIRASQVNRTAAIVATDLERAFTVSGRYRKPMRLACVCGSGTYNVVDLAGGIVRLSRNLRADGQLGTMTLTFSETPVDVYPSGVAVITTPPLTVRITSGNSTRAVTMTTAGQVRIVP